MWLLSPAVIPGWLSVSLHPLGCCQSRPWARGARRRRCQLRRNSGIILSRKRSAVNALGNCSKVRPHLQVWRLPVCITHAPFYQLPCDQEACYRAMSFICTVDFLLLMDQLHKVCYNALLFLECLKYFFFLLFPISKIENNGNMVVLARQKTGFEQGSGDKTSKWSNLSSLFICSVESFDFVFLFEFVF